MSDTKQAGRISLLAKIIRKWDFRSKRFADRLKTAKYRLIGQTEIAKSAVIESEAKITLIHNRKIDLVLKLGPKSRIKDGAFLAPREGFIHIGKGCTINRNCVLLGYGGITIGDNVRMAHNTSMVAFNHVFDATDAPIAEQGNKWLGVTIEDDVWIGAGVRILDGVTVGKGAVIGAGTVITKSVPPGAVMVGASARQLRVRGE